MKAILGSGIDPQTLRLLDEIRTLRSRVDELEQALEQADEARAEVDVEVDVRTDVRTGVLQGAGNR